MNRPFFGSKITDLEALFDKSRNDRDILENLLRELDIRTVDRAKRLRTRVVQALGTLRKDNGPVPAPINSGAVTSPTIVITQQAKAVETAPSAIDSEGYTRVSVDTQILTVKLPKSRPKPSARNTYQDKPVDILSVWTALEVLSPFTFVKPTDLVEGDERRIARFEQGSQLPWEGSGEKARPNTQLFYHIVLGAIRMEEATDALLAAFFDAHADRRPARGFAGIATITVDKSGRPIPENAVAISSFAWGLPLALKQYLKGLDKWPHASTRLAEFVDRKIRKQDTDGNVVPLDLGTIDAAYEALIGELSLPADMIDAPGFALRHYHYWKAQEPPDAPLLGSFYLGDLAAARSLIASNQHRNLARYLRAERPSSFKDLVKDRTALAEAVAPGKMPLGRWPGKGRHPLVLLQQAAVNLAIDGTPSTAMLPVNGPPGTGKTTLLRDLVAALLVGRADAMCSFDDPETAFAYTGEKRRAGAAFTHIYRPDDRLCGFEMLVASSNNRAVENISRELPQLDAIAADATELRYFKTVSDSVAGGDRDMGHDRCGSWQFLQSLQV